MKKDYGKLIENTIRKLELPISKFWLTEGVAEIAKQFPKLPEEKIREIIAYDPTYKGGDELGKYGKWIISLYYNYLKNRERWKQYNNFMKANPDGVNPKTGQKIVEPTYLPEVKPEDTYKIKPLLKQYDILKNKIKKPITAFKDIPSLYGEIQKYKEQGVPQDKKAMERYYVFKNCEEKGLEKIYEDNKWMIGIPENFESSKDFGNYTNWCTTSSYGSYFNHYLSRYGGEYYILLNKENGDLFQFHFESGQFMDERNSSIDMHNFTEDNRKVAQFLNEYKSKKSGVTFIEDDDMKLKRKLKGIMQQFDEYKDNPELIQKNILWTNYTKVEKVDDKEVTGKFDIDSLSNLVYSRTSGDRDLSLEYACGLLTDFWSNYDLYNYSLNDYNYYESDWNNIAEEYGIEKYNWDRICEIYNNETDDEDEIPEEVESIIQDDFYDGTGFLIFLDNCKLTGTENECQKDIEEQFKDNLPITGITLIDDRVQGLFKLTKDELWKIHYIQCMHDDENVPSYEKALKIINTPTQAVLTITDMKEDWFQKWEEKEEYEDDYSDGEDEDWIFIWRCITGKCYMIQGDEGAFNITAPYYDWDGFDDEYFKEGCISAAKRIAKIANKASNIEEKINKEVDKQISEVLRFAK